MVNTPPFSGLVKDNQAGGVGKNQENITIPSNALIKQQAHAVSSPSIALKSNAPVNAWYQGNCEHCKKDFKKKTTWQRFCRPECRDENYFIRTGKKWHSKKAAGMVE